MTKPTLAPVIIIGGGWAGLSAAIHLATAERPVILFESAKQFGGRARSVPFLGKQIDNGQHLLLGAYSETLKIMRACNTQIEQALLRSPLSWKVRKKIGFEVELQTSNLPAPLNFLFAVLFTKGYSFSEKRQTLSFMSRLRRQNFEIKKDTSVETLLAGQPDHVIRTLWEPMCIAALNTPVNIASAKIFLSVMRDSFTKHARDSDALYTIKDLGEIFVKPAIELIQSKGGQVHLSQRVDKLIINNNEIRAIRVNGKDIPASQVIIATPIPNCIRLIKSHDALNDISTKLVQLEHQPICTLYLQYAEDISLNEPMLGLSGITGQWIFDRRFAKQAGLMAVVISADGPHMKLDTDSLAQRVSDELSEYFGWPKPQEYIVIREKRATFSACVDVENLRPDITTPVNGLYLAGDYTRSPYPSTLESAVRSGVQCAQTITQQMNRNAT